MTLSSTSDADLNNGESTFTIPYQYSVDYKGHTVYTTTFEINFIDGCQITSETGYEDVSQAISDVSTYPLNAYSVNTFDDYPLATPFCGDLTFTVISSIDFVGEWSSSLDGTIIIAEDEVETWGGWTLTPELEISFLHYTYSISEDKLTLTNTYSALGQEDLSSNIMTWSQPINFNAEGPFTTVNNESTGIIADFTEFNFESTITEITVVVKVENEKGQPHLSSFIINASDCKLDAPENQLVRMSETITTEFIFFLAAGCLSLVNNDLIYIKAGPNFETTLNTSHACIIYEFSGWGSGDSGCYNYIYF